ncbi:MAG: hypothetical protein ACLRXQ_03595 [Phascolarctobacterium faecium]
MAVLFESLCSNCCLQVVSVKAGRSPKSCAGWRACDFQIAQSGQRCWHADVVLLAVPDGQIAATAERWLRKSVLPGVGIFCQRRCACIAAVLWVLDPLAALSALGIHCGSLHPLQSFAEAAPDLKISAWLLMAIMKHSKLPVIGRSASGISIQFLKRAQSLSCGCLFLF